VNRQEGFEPDGGERREPTARFKSLPARFVSDSVGYHIIAGQRGLSRSSLVIHVKPSVVWSAVLVESSVLVVVRLLTWRWYRACPSSRAIRRRRTSISNEPGSFGNCVVSYFIPKVIIVAFLDR